MAVSCLGDDFALLNNQFFSPGIYVHGDQYIPYVVIVCIAATRQWPETNH